MASDEHRRIPYTALLLGQAATCDFSLISDGVSSAATFLWFPGKLFNSPNQTALILKTASFPMMICSSMVCNMLVIRFRCTRKPAALSFEPAGPNAVNCLAHQNQPFDLFLRLVILITRFSFDPCSLVSCYPSESDPSSLPQGHQPCRQSRWLQTFQRSA